METKCNHPPIAIIRYGIRHNKSGDVQRFMCTKCLFQFSDNQFPKHKFKKEIIEFAMKKYKNNNSSRQIKKLILKKFNVKLSHVTIIRWLHSKNVIFKLNTENRNIIIKTLSNRLKKINKRIEKHNNIIEKHRLKKEKLEKELQELKS